VTRRAPGPHSRALWKRATGLLAGGVDSPVRAFRAVGGTPVFFARGEGAYLVDVDRRRYLDLVGSWGANVLGHAPPPVVAAVQRTAERGLTFGAPSPLEHKLAGVIRRAVPGLERMRFVSSGTEAVMSAVRVARGFTGRPKVVKFAGGYHGHSDGLLARAGSGVATHALPDSAGVPAAIVGQTIVARYNDPEGLERIFERWGSRIAAVVVEPIAANMGLVPPRPGFHPALSSLARRHGALVIADEVITGFRLRRGTIHESLGLIPDLVTLGKIIGGGMPIGLYGGRRRVMETVAPTGPVYQAGTLAGHPVAMAAGLATLERLNVATYRHLEELGAVLGNDLTTQALEEGLEAVTVARRGSMLGLFFGPGPVHDYETARQTDRARYAAFFHAALDRGVYFPPSPLETIFLSSPTTEDDLVRVRPALRAALRAARRSRP
jgi:glutamate-1-semialdehyde 2,1-aminomutase